jgi:hypothetical protein
LKVSVVKLAGKRVNREVLARLSFDLAVRHRCIPLLENDEGGQRVLYLGMEDPTDLAALDEIGFRVGGRVKPVLVASSELEEAFARHDRWSDGDDAEDSGKPAEPTDRNFGDIEFTDDGQDDVFAMSPSDGGTEHAPTGSPAADSDAVSQAAILRALSQLLVEKGVITRDEFVERVRAAMREVAGGA